MLPLCNDWQSNEAAMFWGPPKNVGDMQQSAKLQHLIKGWSLKADF